MRNRYESVVCGGADVHKTFSTVVWRDADQRVVLRERLDHRDRSKLREQLASWPKGVPVVVEPLEELQLRLLQFVLVALVAAAAHTMNTHTLLQISLIK